MILQLKVDRGILPKPIIVRYIRCKLVSCFAQALCVKKNLLEKVLEFIFGRRNGQRIRSLAFAVAEIVFFLVQY